MSSNNDDEMFKNQISNYMNGFEAFIQIKDFLGACLQQNYENAFKLRKCFALTYLDPIFHRLHDRPLHCRMTITSHDETMVIFEALELGWKTYPEYWSGLCMILDYITENMSNDKISRMLKSTQMVVKEIAQHNAWKQKEGPVLMAEQAKTLLISLAHKCNYPIDKHAWAMYALSLVSLGNTAVRSPPGDHNFTKRRICQHVECINIEHGNTKFRKCGRCSRATYCCKECQSSHWAVHQLTCLAPAIDVD